MLKRTTVFAGALAGGLSASQVPEFAQQYEQRLSGAVNELQLIVEDFDKDAADLGLTRDDALSRYQASGDDFLVERGSSMTQTIARFDRLSAQLKDFQNANVFEQALSIANQPDQELVADTFEIYEPAVPVTPGGFIFAALGLVFGGGLFQIIGTILGWPFRRRVRISR